MEHPAAETPAPPETPDTHDAPAAPAPRAPAPARAGKARLDVLLVERGLAPSRERARALIMAGEVRVDGQVVDKAGTLVRRDAVCALIGPAAELKFVSRGGLKLERALDAFALPLGRSALSQSLPAARPNPSGHVCLDVGASTGGFTDVLLRRGAQRVYAIDVGHGQIAWTLRTDPRVVVMDRTNIRHLRSLPEPADCAVIDVSFISLRLVLPRVATLLAAGGWIVALVKPQFEAGRAEADRGAGVIADPDVHRRVLRGLLAWIATWRGERDEAAPSADAAGGEGTPATATDGLWLAGKGLIASPITGREGNHEYLLWMVTGAGDREAARPVVGDEDVERAVREAFASPARGQRGSA